MVELVAKDAPISQFKISLKEAERVSSPPISSTIKITVIDGVKTALNLLFCKLSGRCRTF